MLTFIPSGYTAHAISGFIISGLILFGVWLLTSITSAGVARRILIVAVVSSGISQYMAENLYGQVSYGVSFCIASYMIYFSYGFVTCDIERKRKKYFGAAVLILVILVFWANPQRALIYYFLPLAMTLLWFRSKIVLRSKDESRSALLLTVVLIPGAVLGALFHDWTLNDVNNIQGTSVRWLSYDSMLGNAILTLKGYIFLSGGLPTQDGNIVSIAGIYEVLRFGAALVFLGLMPYLLMQVFRNNRGGDFFLGAFALAAFFAVCFLQITTTIPNMSDPLSSSRYLVPSIMLLLVFVLAQPSHWSKSPLISLATTAIALVFVTSAYSTFLGFKSINTILSAQAQHHLEDLGDFLEKNSLRYGYAGFWNAGVLSVISDEKVLVRQILLNRGIPEPHRWLSSNRWYRASAWQGETFLLLSHQDCESVNWELFESYVGRPTRELVYGNFKIMVYDRNIASLLPGWDTRYESPMTFLATKHSLKQTGRFVENYDNGDSALVAEKGEAGALHFGPYIGVEPGKYRIKFQVSADYNDKGSVRLDIASDAGAKILAEKELLSSNEEQQFTIGLEEFLTLEFRVWALGTERVLFKGITIERVPDHDQI